MKMAFLILKMENDLISHIKSLNTFEKYLILVGINKK